MSHTRHLVTATAHDRRPQILQTLSGAFSGRCVRATKLRSTCFQMELANLNLPMVFNSCVSVSSLSVGQAICEFFVCLVKLLMTHDNLTTVYQIMPYSFWNNQKLTFIISTKTIVILKLFMYETKNQIPPPLSFFSNKNEQHRRTIRLHQTS